MIFLLLAVSAQSATACSCIIEKKLSQEAIARAVVIFEGTVLQVDLDTSANEKLVTVSVDRTLLSKGIEADTLILRTATDGSACGLDFHVGERWYLFPYAYQDTLRDGLCGRSRRLAYQTAGASTSRHKASDRRRRLKQNRRHYARDRRAIKKYLRRHD